MSYYITYKTMLKFKWVGIELQMKFSKEVKKENLWENLRERRWYGTRWDTGVGFWEISCRVTQVGKKKEREN